MATSTTAETISDTVTTGVPYEYEAKLDYVSDASLGYVMLPQFRRFVAGTEIPPRHQRGNVLLLVDSTLATPLSTELTTLKSALVGDGWTVATWTGAPRHNDMNFSANAANRDSVANWISTHKALNVPNVIFILGHVTIPYSGTYPADGHTLSKGNHRGAWTCDAYYGCLTKSLWTDTQVVNSETDLAVPNDGKFD